MMNVHGFYRQGQAVDAVINCTKFERPQAIANGEDINCQALSAFNKPKLDASTGPFGFIASPIFPANDPDTLVGFIFGAVYWIEVMEEMVRFTKIKSEVLVLHSLFVVLHRSLSLSLSPNSSFTYSSPHNTPVPSWCGWY